MVAKQSRDEEKVKLFRCGCVEVLEELFLKYQPLIKKYIRRYHFHDLDDDDLLQESRIVLYEALLSYQSEKNACFFTYFNHLLHNRFVRLVRYYKAYKRRSDLNCLPYEECMIDHYNYSTLTPLDIVIVRESFDDGYQTLTKSEKKVISHYESSDRLKSHNVYRCAVKMKKALRCD